MFSPLYVLHRAVLNGTGRLAPTIMGFLNSQRSGQGGPEAAGAPAGQAHGEQYDEQYAQQHQEQDDQYDDWDDAQEDGLGPGSLGYVGGDSSPARAWPSPSALRSPGGLHCLGEVESGPRGARRWSGARERQ